MRARLKTAGKETLSQLGKVNLEPLVAGLLRRREAVFENIAVWRTLEQKEGGGSLVIIRYLLSAVSKVRPSV